MMTVFIGFAAVAIDVGFWEYQGRRQQQAADQAALAGVVFLPDRPELAINAARRSAAQNGFRNDLNITVGTGRFANRLTVGIGRKHRSFFGKVLSINSADVFRRSTAEYVPPLSVGNPAARAGNDPEQLTGNPNFWLHQKGPWDVVHNGDRFASDICNADNSVAHPTPFGCTPSTNTRGRNSEYQRIGRFGYRYSLDVTAIQPGMDLAFEVFDGVNANVGDFCQLGRLPSAAEIAAMRAWLGAWADRYANTPQWCAPDAHVNHDNEYMDTQFEVFSPDRSVAQGAAVELAAPTPEPPGALNPLGPGGGRTVQPPCAQTRPATTMTLTNDRATNLQLYWVNAVCVETLVETIAPGDTKVVSVMERNRYSLFDETSREIVSEFEVPNNPSPFAFAAHLRTPTPAPPCFASGQQSDLFVDNPTSNAVDVFELDANCREVHRGTVASGTTLRIDKVHTGQIVRLYDNAQRVISEFAMVHNRPPYTVPTTGPAPSCSPPTGAPATITFVNRRSAPIRIYSIGQDCFFNNEQTIPAGGTWTSPATYAGSLWAVRDTYGGGILRTHTATPGSQTVIEEATNQTTGNCSTAAAGQDATSIQFKNERTTTLLLRRVDENCAMVDVTTIPPGGSPTYPTWDGQRWKVYDGANIALDTTVIDVQIDPQEATRVFRITPGSTFTWDPNAGNRTTNGAQLRCTRVETTYPLTTYNAGDPYTGTIMQLVNPADGVHDNGAGTRDEFAESFVNGFRRWRQICRIPAAEVEKGRYTITVRTNTNNDAAGSNAYSMRAAWVMGTPETARGDANLRLSAMENFPVFINTSGTTQSTLYLTRLHPTLAGKSVRVQLFDIGDAATGTVNLRIVPPADANLGATWPCTMVLRAQDGTHAPSNADTTTCSINGLTRTVYNGVLIQFDIDLPDTFTCNPSVLTNCWAKVEITPNGANAQLTDRTTWSASVLGDPLRLIG